MKPVTSLLIVIEFRLVRYLDEKNVETTITYGLSRLCLLKVTQPTNATSEYMDLECRPFPSKVLDDCEKENAQFCVAWKSARYCVVLAAWCASAVLCAIVFGVSTRSRRRRIWRVVVTLLLLHGSSLRASSFFFCVTFALAPFSVASAGSVLDYHRSVSQFPLPNV